MASAKWKVALIGWRLMSNEVKLHLYAPAAACAHFKSRALKCRQKKSFPPASPFRRFITLVHTPLSLLDLIHSFLLGFVQLNLLSLRDASRGPADPLPIVHFRLALEQHNNVSE